MVVVVKHPPASAGDKSERYSGEGHGNPLQYPCLRNPWTEDSGGLQSMRSRSDMTEETSLTRINSKNLF